MCGSGRDEEPSGGEALRLIQIRLATLNFEKISLARQGNLPQMRIGTSSSTNAGNFSSRAQRTAFRRRNCAGKRRRAVNGSPTGQGLGLPAMFQNLLSSVDSNL